jgi:hypothetical protein
MNTEPYESMSHGLTTSKIWLCTELEKILLSENKTYNVCILGSWTNILSYMMCVRNSSLYSEILAYDNDQEAIDAANKICDTWRFETPSVRNILMDANAVTYENTDLIINSSVEHMKFNYWFYNIPDTKLVCIQSSNVNNPDKPWYITNPNSSLDELKEKYQLSKILYEGVKEIRYNHWGYDRYMIIGYK